MNSGVSGLTKHYGGVPALSDVTMSVRPGEIRALLGQNGAGKSTLIGCLGGRTVPDSGEILINGTTYESLNPKQSKEAGVAVIYQHLSLIGSLTVADNIFLGSERSKSGFLDRAEQRRVTTDILHRVGASCGPDDIIDDLSIGQRQLVEIAKAMQRNARLMILDEPTAALSRSEADALGRHVLRLRDQGIAILYVTHLLSEVDRLADTVTVMRNGAVVLDAAAEGISRRALVEAITGGSVDSQRRQSISRTYGSARFETSQLQAKHLGPVDLTVHAGEIVGIIGLMGSGRTRLLETLAGARKMTGGTAKIDGKEYRPRNPNSSITQGVALVPADRLSQGLFLDLSALDNALMKVGDKLAAGFWRRRSREYEVFAKAAASLSLRPADPDLPSRGFSGGNQQKILLSRWVNAASGVKVLLLDDPTQGVDVGAREEIYSVVRDLAEKEGLAVLFTTSDPEEMLLLADRGLIMHDGSIVAEPDLDNETEDSLAYRVQNTLSPAAESNPI